MNTEKFSRVLSELSSKKTRSFLDSKKALSSSKHLEPSKVVNHVLYDGIKTITSCHLSDEQFTNFLNDRLTADFQDKILPLITGKKSLDSTMYSLDSTKVDLNKRIKKIFNEYVNPEDFQVYKDAIRKISIKDSLGRSTSHRIYFYKNRDSGEYVIFLIDPLHLVIPDAYTKSHKVYQKNVNNRLCISNIVNHK